MTLSEKRQARRIRREWIRFSIHMILLAIIGILIIGNQWSIQIMQTDALDKLNEIGVTLDMEDTAATKTVAIYHLTPEERDLVERVVAAEARGEDLQTMMGVAQTILDRAELWDMTLAEVVQAPGQYAGPYQGEISDEVKLAVSDVFDVGVRVFNQPVTHFYDDSISPPYWTEDKTCRGGDNRMKFYY